MSLLNTAGSIAIWWRVILPFTIIGIIFTLIGIITLTTPKKKGYKITKGIIQTIAISKSEPKSKKNSSGIYYDHTYSMAVQFTNKKTDKLVTSNLVTTTQSPDSYSVGGGINIEYDKNNCTANACNIVLGSTTTKNTVGGIALTIGIVCVLIGLGAFIFRNNKNLQGFVVISGTFNSRNSGNSVMGKLADGAVGFLKK